MGSDFATFAVAAVGVAGTLGATVVTQIAALRGRRFDAENTRIRQAEDRAESARKNELDEKRSVYSDLNAAVRDYRMALHDCVLEPGRGHSVRLKRVDDARARYREMYARAQMIVPERVLIVVSEIDLGLGNCFRTLTNVVDAGTDRRMEVSHRWLDGPGSEAIWLLREVLREDLGTAGSLADLDGRLDRLRQARVEALGSVGGGPECGLVGDAGVQQHKVAAPTRELS
ncbi:hypothetical protein KO481_12575 [Nocardia sp. NEAU-G5]|uniref:Secreted protein n=1 Tax=Nocardia albiluteola TaxID=2842303 RepID=A0ABS6AWD9_9NOCA|nr:hypothetical protein [Nocardia albiluteola]MBU3062358.1 hypothetical protein [Nocardia albiluteola]